MNCRRMTGMAGCILAVFFSISIVGAMEVKDSGFIYGKDDFGRLKGSQLVYDVNTPDNNIGRTVSINTGKTTFTLMYSAFQKSDGNYVSKAIGLYTRGSAGWYNQGFLYLNLDDLDICNYLADFELAQATSDEGRVVISWVTPKGKVKAIFTAPANDDKLLLEIQLEPKGEVKKAYKLSLLAYPGGYPLPRDRWMATGKREEQNTKLITLANDEPWVFLYDKIYNAESCGVLYLPKEANSAQVQLGNYDVWVNIIYPPNTRILHLILWKFDSGNKEALEYMKSLSLE